MRIDKQRFKFADKLRGICSRSGLSHEEIAEKSDIRKQTLYNYINGTRAPNTSILKKILKTCGAEWSEVEP